MLPSSSHPVYKYRLYLATETITRGKGAGVQMRRRYLTVVAVLVLAGLVGSILWAPTATAAEDDREAPRCGLRERLRGFLRHRALPAVRPERLWQHLQLSEEQWSSLAELFREALPRIQQLRNDIEETRLEMWLESLNPQRDEERLETLRAQLEELHQQLRELHQELWEQARELLTEEQLETLRKVRQRLQCRHLRDMWRRFKQPGS